MWWPENFNFKSQENAFLRILHSLCRISKGLWYVSQLFNTIGPFFPSKWSRFYSSSRRFFCLIRLRTTKTTKKSFLNKKFMSFGCVSIWCKLVWVCGTRFEAQHNKIRRSYNSTIYFYISVQIFAFYSWLVLLLFYTIPHSWRE